MNSKLVLSLFAVTGAFAMGCGGGGSSSTNTDAGGGGNTIDGTDKSQYAANSLTLPTGPTKFALDVNGDNNPDNRLGQIVSAINFAGLSPQTTATTAVGNGSVLLLFEEQSSDTSQQSAKNAGVKFALGTKPAAAPKFDGTDTFTADSTYPPAQFYGNIAGGVFTSAAPAKATAATEVEFTLNLPLVEGQPALQLPIIGGAVTITVDSSGKITGGQLNGAVTKDNIDNRVIPAVAALLTAQIAADPSNTTLASFDTNSDGTVTPDEIKANPAISSFLAPDVQMFQNGVYAPNSSNTTKDSLSIGLGITGVKAMWQ